MARTPCSVGKGAIEGVAAPEASNYSAAQTAFIPTLGMGIPGTASMAIILAALMINNITPGPRLIAQHPDLFWAVVASFWIGNLLLLVLNIPLIGIWVRLLKIPYDLLYPCIVVLRSEEHTSELQSLMRTSYAVFCLKKKNTPKQ